MVVHQIKIKESSITNNLLKSRNENCEQKCKLKLFFDRIYSYLKPILCGQFLSLLICGTSVSSKYIEIEKIDTPVFQNLFNYILLFLIYTSILFMKKNDNGERLLYMLIKESWYKYLFIAIIDVEANYLIVLAYQYTTLTSVQLLDCFVIVVVMLLSCYFLGVRYKMVHFIGLAVSLVGVVCMVVADVLLDDNKVQAPNAALGDILVLTAACCYGTSNVAMEYVTKSNKQGNFHILGMLGLFCPVICGVQAAILEHEKISSIAVSWKVTGLFVAFTICMFTFYSCMPLIMKTSSATVVNISILTADLFALFVGHFLFQQKFSVLYLVSLATIVVALVVYNSKKPLRIKVNKTFEAEQHKEAIEADLFL